MYAADGLATTQATKSNILLEPFGYRIVPKTYPNGKTFYQVFSPNGGVPINKEMGRKVTDTAYSMQAVGLAYAHYEKTTGRKISY